MRTREFIADIQDAVPRVTPAKVKQLLALFLIFVGCLAALVVLASILPQAEIEGLKRYGYLGVFLANLLPSLSVVFPAHLFFSGHAISVFVAGLGNPLLVAVVASLGSTLGEVTAYFLGYSGQHLLKLERFRRYQVAESWMRRRGWLAVVTSAFLPIFIFDFVGIAAGALKLSLPKFLFFTFLGRLPRAIIEVYFFTWIFENIVSHLPSFIGGPFSG